MMRVCLHVRKLLFLGKQNLTQKITTMIWKEIDINIIEKNCNNLDIEKMYKFGAIKSSEAYHALEIERGENEVRVLARLERGFEEYICLKSSDYDLIPILENHLV